MSLPVPQLEPPNIRRVGLEWRRSAWLLARIGTRQAEAVRDKAHHHGASLLPRVRVDSHGVEIQDEKDSSVIAKTSACFQDRLKEWRERLRGSRALLDGVPTSKLYKDKRDLQEVLIAGEAEPAELLIGAIEDFAQDLKVFHRLLEVEGWQRKISNSLAGL
jgi:hypothetical protein